MQERIRRVALIGAECTGKTSLAVELSRRLGARFVPEAARVWARTVARPLTSFDVERIASIHLRAALKAQRAAFRAGEPILLLDTDLVSTLVYARHYHGVGPRWLRASAAGLRSDLYLLCTPEMGWEAEPGQRSTPREQAAVQLDMERALGALGCRHVRLEGTLEFRAGAAMRAIQEIP
jgi:nicotinamide riboside kinase